ncbi:MAG: ankyrin repeat domain-containing protein [Gemmatimonadota bacterium]
MTSDNIRETAQALANAIAKRDYDLADGLLGHGAEVNRIMRRTETFDRDIVEESTTYLIDAAIAGDAETVKFLLERGADPNIASAYSGRTALLSATRYGYTSIVDLLLAHGADVTLVDRYNATNALGEAIARVNVPIVRSLLAAGARGGIRRLGFSVEGGAGAREVVRLLVEHGSDINEVDDWGRTPLMWAAEFAEPETVRFMLELGADVNRISEANMNGVRSNETALSLARRRKRDDVVAVLLQHGARDVASAGRNAVSLWARLCGLLTG